MTCIEGRPETHKVQKIILALLSNNFSTGGGFP